MTRETKEKGTGQRVVRVRRHPAWHAVVLPDGQVIEPGQETDAIPVEEARQRPDFLVEEQE